VLRRKFSGKPEYVVNYFFLVAEEARELMAQLGARRFSELIGRTDLLDMKKGIEHWKAKGLDFSRFSKCRTCPRKSRATTRKTESRTREGSRQPADRACATALERGEKVSIDMPIRNGNRAVGTMLSHEIARRYGHEGLPDGTIHARLPGPRARASGPSSPRRDARSSRRHQRLLRKRPFGRHIIVSPSPKFRGEPTENIITGNVVLTERSREKRISAALPASASRCAIPGLAPWSKAWVTMDVNT